MRRFISLIIVFLFFVSMGASVKASGIDDKKQQLEGLKNDISDVQDALDQTELQQMDVSQQIEQLDKQLDQKQAELNKTEKELQDTSKQLDEAQKELEQAIKDVEQQKSMLDARLKAMYMSSSADYLEMILEANSFNDLIMRIEMAIKMAQYDKDMLLQLKQKQTDIEGKKKTIEDHKQKIEQQKKLISQEKQYIQDKQNEKKKLLDELTSKKEEYEKALDEMEAQSKELEDVIRKLQAEEEAKRKAQQQANRSTATPVSTGQFKWPVPGQARISSPFGSRIHPILGYRKEHTGIDIAAPQGVNVVAADSGVVIVAGWLGSYGKAVIIDHGDGISTLYGHNSELLVSVGQQVSAGQVIAHVGQTGLATGPHCHFEVRINGVPVNPMQYYK